ncbi:MAG: glucarate dehydratase [Acidobacteriia bacterium]|nr:glucarate dehydratase [Terriglobia bacterium]
MKIKDLRVHSIAIADPPLRSSYGLHAPYALRNIVELESEDGIVGIAETYGGEGPADALRKIAPDVVGKDAYRLTGDLLDAAEGEGTGSERSHVMSTPGENPLDVGPRTYSAIETASLDLIGRSVGVPVCDLIGGRVRDEVPFSAYAFYKHGGGGGEGTDAREDKYGECLTPESIVRQVRSMVDEYGFKDVKLKGGVLDPEQEVETVRQLRQEFGPAVPQRIDPNSAWTVETSVRVGKALREELTGGGYLEDPAAGIDGMAEVRAALLGGGIDTPLASNVAVTSFAHLPETIERDAVQVVLCDHHFWGGMRQVQHLGKLCQTFGLALSMHSNSHLGISLMAMTHVAAATKNLTYACDTHYPWQTSDEVIVGGRLKFVGGSMRVPERGGLGVDIDRDQLARLKERYDKIPYRRRDDAAEMRKHIDPGWQRILPRW